MASALFPSGDWYGFYTYQRHPGRHPMDIRFTFEDGRISASGGDPVGEFVLTGDYCEQSRECHWIKRYLGAHSVSYQGFREGKGIWGTWELPLFKGGFHVWPVGTGGRVEHRVEEQAEPASAALDSPRPQPAENRGGPPFEGRVARDLFSTAGIATSTGFPRTPTNLPVPNRRFSPLLK